MKQPVPDDVLAALDTVRPRATVETFDPRQHEGISIGFAVSRDVNGAPPVVVYVFEAYGGWFAVTDIERGRCPDHYAAHSALVADVVDALADAGITARGDGLADWRTS